MTIIAWIICVVLLLLAAIVAGLMLYAAWTARRVEKALPPLGRFVEVDGGRIHYLEQGSGPTLLLIHGLGGQMRNFTHSLLERLKGDYRLIIVDRPGSGYSTRPPGASATIRAQADTVARFMDALRLERPLVVGHSLGGAIALSLALNHPEKVGGLALLAPLTHAQIRGAGRFSGARRHLAAVAMAHRLDVGDPDVDQESRACARRGLRSEQGTGRFRDARRRPAQPAAWKFHLSIARPDGDDRRSGDDAGALCGASSFLSASCSEPATASSTPRRMAKHSRKNCPAPISS